MAYLAVAVSWASSIAGAVYLVTHGHPWFGALVLLIGMSAKTYGRNEAD